MKKVLLFLFSVFFLVSCGSVENNTNDKEKEIVPEKEEKKEDITNINLKPVLDSEINYDSLILANEVGMESYINSLMESTDSYIPSWNKEGFKDKWNYIDGVFLKSMLSLYDQTKENKYLDFVVKYVDYYLTAKGNFLRPSGSDGAPYALGELDSVCETNILFDLYKYTNNQKYLHAILTTYKIYTANVPRLSDGICYSHKDIYPNQVWLDGFYMYAPFTIKYALCLDDEAKKDALLLDLYNQYKFVREHLFSEEKQLYYHGYSETDIFWAAENKCSKSFWLRSNGWFLASLADVLEYYPKGEKRDYLKSIFIEAIDGILKYQDADSKMFYQVIDRKGDRANISYSQYSKYLNDYKEDVVIENYLESSGSLLLVYSILKGFNNGTLNSDYYNKGIEIYNGVTSKYFIDNELKNICITAGLGPETKLYRDGSFEYYLAEAVGSNDAKGVGPLIMSYVETKRTAIS